MITEVAAVYLLIGAGSGLLVLSMFFNFLLALRLRALRAHLAAYPLFQFPPPLKALAQGRPPLYQLGLLLAAAAQQEGYELPVCQRMLQDCYADLQSAADQVDFFDDGEGEARKDRPS